MRNQRRVIGMLLALLLLIAGCDGGEQEASQSRAPEARDPEEKTVYTAPEISAAVFHRELAAGDEAAAIDVSAVSEGYVAVSARSQSRLKFQVIKDSVTYTYDLPNDGRETIFGLQSGDGSYRFRIMENVVDTSYIELFSTEAEVRLLDEFQPFLRTNQYADYSENSDCVKKARELAGEAGSQLEAAGNIYAYILDHITYDKEKAATVQSGYIPSPDETLETGKGICFDYASLAASMLRSQGIPTKIIFGYVAPEELYHAWNMFYTEESGWITVEFQVSGEKWNRMDCTFAANGADPSTIGSGENYTDLYVY